jgi:hypothetical protein
VGGRPAAGAAGTAAIGGAGGTSAGAVGGSGGGGSNAGASGAPVRLDAGTAGGSGTAVDAGNTPAADARVADAGAGGAGGAVSFKKDIAPVAMRTCGVVACHIAGSAQAHGMDLVSPEKIYRNWVNAKGFDHCNEGKGGTGEFPIRITPFKTGDRDSYILTKVRNTTSLCPPTSQRMPFPPATAWTAAEVELLRQWIVQGALNN